MNKIGWLDWGQEAFDKARSSGKPILLDITGSWCHWCHVMDETSYSDPVIISTITKSFIPVRVDTDQRPDVNRRYNLGGWPTTAFLDANGKIITGGTYIPPQQLRDALRSVLDFYSTNKSKIGSKLSPKRIPLSNTEPVSERIVRDIATTIAVNFDIEYGGFGFEPKFPHPDALDLALLRYRYGGEKEMLPLVTKTLERMASGGMYDQVEDGFFRYSTTRDWSIPHFEKMAEDNAKLLAVYVHAYQITGRDFFKKKAEGIVRYAQSYLSDNQGGFFGSQDADEQYYKLDLATRKQHQKPAIDKTLYTNYNSLFVSSFLLASSMLGNADVGRFALKTLDRMISLGKQFGLPFRFWKEDEGASLNGFLVDYATLLNSLLDAYEYTGKSTYLDLGRKIADDCIKNLTDKENQGFYDIPGSNSNLGELKTQDKPIDENSVMATSLMRLSWLSGETSYSEIAGKTLQLFNQDYERHGLSASVYGLAIDSYLNGPIGVTIVGDSKSKEFTSLKQKALKTYSARRYILCLDSNRDTKRIELLGYKNKVAAAYVCVGKTCGPPVEDPAKMDDSLTSLLESKPMSTV